MKFHSAIGYQETRPARRPPWPRNLTALTCLVGPLALALLLGCSREEQFPSRPVTIVCPWNPGGGSDRVCRQVAVQLQAELGVPVNVVNATGGAGVTGHTRGARARPDGYTLAMITPELNLFHWRGLTTLSYRDFDPLMSVNGDDAALFVAADSPHRDLAALTAAIRQSPGRLKASGSATGSIWHLAAAGWLLASGLGPDDVAWISINGSAPSLQELLAGGLDLVCCSVPEAQALLDADRIRCLAVMGAARSPAVPQAPTLQEQNIAWSLTGYRGFALPLGVAPPRRDRILTALEKVVGSEEYQGFLATAGFGYQREGPALFRQSLAAADERFGKILTSPEFQSPHGQPVGPLFFPSLLAGFLLATIGGLAYTGQFRLPAESVRLSWRDRGDVAWVAALFASYVLLAETVGFLLCAGIILGALLWRLRAPNWARWTIPVLAAPVIYQVFAVWQGAPLPQGWFGW